jgi:hypothetical protein
MQIEPRKKTGGRQKGTPNKRSKKVLLAEAAEKARKLLGDDGGIFDGNALAYLMSLYKNPMLDIETRKDAAKAAIPFESSRLMASTVAHSGTLTLESLVTEAIKNPPSE